MRVIDRGRIKAVVSPVRRVQNASVAAAPLLYRHGNCSTLSGADFTHAILIAVING
jgi:hypothetical protein